MSGEPSRRVCEAALWFVLFFGPACFGATEWWSLAVLESAIFFLAALCARRGDFSSPLGGPLAGFVVVPLMGAAQALHARSLADPASLLPWTLARPQTLHMLLEWTAWSALLWAASGVLRWEGAFRRLSWCVLGVGLFVALTGILQLGQGNAAYYGLRPILIGHPFGPFTNSDHAATWLVAAAFVGAGLFVAGFRPRGRMPLTERVAQQLMIVFVLALLIVAVFMTGSRGGAGALALSALVTVSLVSGSLERPGVRLSLRGALVLVAFAYVYFLYANPKWRGVSDGILDVSTAYRVSMYRSGLRLLADFPLFGTGLGGFAVAFHSYQEPSVVGLVTHVHCSWLEIALETGLFGLAAFGLAVFHGLRLLAGRVVSNRFFEGVLFAGWLGALLSFLIHGLVEFSFQIPGDAVLFVVLLAAGSAAFPIVAENPSAAARPWRSVLATLFVLLAFLSLPSGFPGGVPRLGAPFESFSEIFPIGNA